jgi:hypothetical protein
MTEGKSHDNWGVRKGTPKPVGLSETSEVSETFEVPQGRGTTCPYSRGVLPDYGLWQARRHSTGSPEGWEGLRGRQSRCLLRVDQQPKPVASQKHQLEPQLPTVNCSALSGSVSVLHSHDYISYCVPLVNIPISLSSLVQRIASIYGQSYLSRLDKLFERQQMFRTFG